LAIKSQAPKIEDGYRGEKMKNKENEKKEEEWIEKTVECPDCNKGRTVHWKEHKSGKPPWRHHFPCATCKGDYQTKVWQPKYCQIIDCNNHATIQCGEVNFGARSWVCDEHWKEDDVGFGGWNNHD